MGASKKLYLRIQGELDCKNIQYEILNSYEEEESFKEKKRNEKIQHSKLREVQKRSQK